MKKVVISGIAMLLLATNGKSNAPVDKKLFKDNEIRIISLSATKTDSKIQVHFAQLVKNPNVSDNLIAELNSSDERFSGNGTLRMAWVTIEKADAHKLGITAEMIAKLEEVSKNGEILVFENAFPATLLKDGSKKPLRIRQIDSVEGSEYQISNILERCKRYPGKNGVKYPIVDGKFIFSNKTIVLAEDQNSPDVILNADQLLNQEQAEELVVMLANKENAVIAK